MSQFAVSRFCVHVEFYHGNRPERIVWTTSERSFGNPYVNPYYGSYYAPQYYYDYWNLPLSLLLVILRHGSCSYLRSGRPPDWLKMKNPACAAVTREAEEDWAR